LEAAQGDIGDQRVAVAEMAVGRSRADPGPARRLGKGKAGRPLARDQIERRLDQRLAQIAVVIAAALPRSLFRPPHVNDYNIATVVAGSTRIPGASGAGGGRSKSQLAVRSEPYGKSMIEIAPRQQVIISQK